MKPVSFSFSVGDKPGAACSKRIHEEISKDDKEKILEFRATNQEEQNRKKVRKVIPCKPNRLQGQQQPKKQQHKEDPRNVGKLEDRFQEAARQEEAVGEYGLLRAGRKQPTDTPCPASGAAPSKGKVGVGLDWADEPSAEDFDSMPVEDFGMALLLGMGMTEENKVETVQYVARPARMGLGADPTKMGTLNLWFHRFSCARTFVSYHSVAALATCAPLWLHRLTTLQLSSCIAVDSHVHAKNLMQQRAHAATSI
jgi:hypothetical protein